MGFPRLAPKGARAIALVHHAPKAIRAVTPSGNGSFRCPAGGSRALPVPVCGWNASDERSAEAEANVSGEALTYCYVVDMGTIIQGGLNITFRHGAAGQRVTVIASELLVGMNGFHEWSGAVQPNGTDESVHYDQWTLASAREQTIVTHEYIVARFWQVIGAPEPPSADSIQGWKVWYPMNKPSPPAKGGLVAGPSVPPPDDSHAGQTTIHTSSDDLNSVYELCRFTGRTGAMDVNTDSNARQVQYPPRRLLRTEPRAPAN